MRHTKNETTTQTLTRLITALDKQQPVTITYTKADGTETIRTVEIADLIVTAAGDILIKAMDRETSEARSFRIDRIVTYTIHRTTAGLATVTVLYPVDCPALARVQLLAVALAA